MFVALVALAGAKCSDKAPPIDKGKCVVDEYDGTVAVTQNCAFTGQNYACKHQQCKRTGEAVGERPAVTQ